MLYGFMAWSTGHGLVTMLELHSLSVIHGKYICNRLLLDSRGVELPMAYNPTLVILSSLKSLFFNSLRNESRFSDNVGA